jgi:hypothetical protein
MRKLFLIIAAILLGSTIWAQSPQKMSYQAVIRNSSDQLVNSQVVGMKISILQGSESGTTVYSETQTPTTNANGLVSIEIGGGTLVSGDFTTINWANGLYFIKTEIDPEGSTSYSITGTNQLLSVPYALFAKTAGAHYVGELYGGGVIFCVDKSGDHGLICSMLDQSTSQKWSILSSLLIGTSEWDGKTNSTSIITANPDCAAKLCDDYINTDYGTGIYSDWYLPAIDELIKLFTASYEVSKAIDGDGNASTVSLTKYYYWSSTDATAANACTLDFKTGSCANNFTKSNVLNVRSIRAF